MNYQLVVIGAGPAGLAAAAEARGLGLTVLVLDEQSAPGGQIYRQVERVSGQHAARARTLGPDYLRGVELVREFRMSGADYLPGSLVWRIEPGEVWYIRDGVVHHVTAGRILMATGAIERPMARPGWTLPGVLSAGGAQIMLKTSGLVPSADAVLMGSGPLLYLIANQILKMGGRFKALVETVPTRRYLTAAPHLPSAMGLGYLGKGAKMLLGLGRSGVKIYRGATDLEIVGQSWAEAVRFRQGSRQMTLETDTVILHEGVIPNQQITRLANCSHYWDADQHCFVPDRDDWGNTSADGLMVAGDGGGIGGAEAAELAGRIAAFETARALGRLTEAERDACSSAYRTRHTRLVRGRRFLEVLYAPSEPVPVSGDTIVCRCEEVTAGQIRQIVAGGSHGPNQVKSYLRCGMGPCQGRMCGSTVTAIIAQARGVAPDAVDYFRIRPPLKPIPLTALAHARLDEAEAS